jgi:hypothetical protein
MHVHTGYIWQCRVHRLVQVDTLRCTNIWTDIHRHTHTYMNRNRDTPTSMHVYPQAHMCMQTCTYNIYSHLLTHKCSSHVNARTHIHLCTNMHTHIHTETHWHPCICTQHTFLYKHEHTGHTNTYTHEHNVQTCVCMPIQPCLHAQTHTQYRHAHTDMLHPQAHIHTPPWPVIEGRDLSFHAVFQALGF